MGVVKTFFNKIPFNLGYSLSANRSYPKSLFIFIIIYVIVLLVNI
ncbi:MAG: hypothetical protein H6Q12_1061 [Bacteroidetes bacterium]|nr:hypothetical protein [Bacteroidota bacterium]